MTLWLDTFPSCLCLGGFANPKCLGKLVLTGLWPWFCSTRKDTTCWRHPESSPWVKAGDRQSQQDRLSRQDRDARCRCPDGEALVLASELEGVEHGALDGASGRLHGEDTDPSILLLFCNANVLLWGGEWLYPQKQWILMQREVHRRRSCICLPIN